MARDARFASMITAKRAVVFCLVAAAAFAAAGQEKITLGLHLKAGQTFHVLTTTESNLTQTILGQEMNSASNVAMGYTCEVQQVSDDGVATVKVTYTTVQVKMSVGGSNMEFDSTKPQASASPFVKPFTALIGQSLSLAISPTGQVKDVQGVEAIYEKMLRDMELPNEAMRPMVEQQIKEQFGANSTRETMEQAIGAGFPEKAVAIGDSWAQRTDLARPYPMILQSTYTLKDRKAGVAIIDVVSKISTNPTGKPTKIGPMTMTYEMSGERKGQMEVDEATGWITGARSTQQISGTIKAEGGPQGPMSFPISGTITTRIEWKK